MTSPSIQEKIYTQKIK